MLWLLLVGVSNKHWQINLYLYALGPDGVLKDTRFILIRAECPYVQSAAARVISTEKGSWYGVQTVERGIGTKSLMERSKGCQELDCCLAVSYVWNQSIPLVGCPALPFIDQGGAGVTDGRKRKKPKVENVLQRCRVFLFP